jgi:hypothetical protein
MLYIATLVGAIVAATVTDAYSTELAAVLDREPAPPMFRNFWVGISLAAGLVIGGLASLAGLFRFKRWGRSGVRC